MTPAFANSLIALLPSLRRYARALCGNAALADDLVQDSIERALGHADSLRLPERMGAWMRGILYRQYLDELRRRRAWGEAASMDDIAEHPALTASADSMGAAGEMDRALQRVSLEHRQILLLAGVELSYREIADELQVPLGTVMSRLARARTALRGVLEGGQPALPP